MKERLREIDFLRTISTLAVIAIHITGPYIYKSGIPYYLNQMVRFAVPMFIIISGLLLWNTDNNYSKYKGIRGYYEFIKRRLRKVFIPYVIWSVIYILFKARNELDIILELKGVFFSNVLRNLLLGTSHSHLYFVIIIIQMYFLYPILRTFLKRAPKVTVTLSFVITLFFQAGVYLQMLNIAKLPTFVIPYYIFFPTWVFYFIFGMLFSMNISKWKSKFDGRIPIYGSVWLVGLIILLIDNKYTETFASSIKPSVMFFSIMTFLFFYVVATELYRLNWKLWDAIEWLSLQSYNIYLSHLLIVDLINLASVSLGIVLLWQRIRGMVILYILTVLLSCTLAYVLSITPFSELLGCTRIISKRKLGLRGDRNR